MSLPNFWNSKESKDVIIQVKRLKSIIEPWIKIEYDLLNTEELILLAEEESDEKIEIEINKDIQILEKKVLEQETKVILGKEEDFCNAFLSINAGAGGTESCDWVDMLYRMYIRWAEEKGFTYKIVDMLQGEEAGIKNLMILIKGEYAYGLLKSEIGVHRLVRISPFDSNKRRHTSFASVDLIPEIDENIDIEVNETDLKIDTYRAGGKGGQHVNTTDSAVRITHIPTGIIAQCQNERSQHKNKSSAMKVLKARLYDLELKNKQAEIDKSYEKKGDIAWGNQIRSYVFHPYSMVKDHRTNYQTGNVSAIMDGKLDGFIEEYLRWAKKKK
jgi:peptide chain release factor 2